MPGVVDEDIDTTEVFERRLDTSRRWPSASARSTTVPTDDLARGCSALSKHRLRGRRCGRGLRSRAKEAAITAPMPPPPAVIMTRKGSLMKTFWR